MRMKKRLPGHAGLTGIFITAAIASILVAIINTLFYSPPIVAKVAIVAHVNGFNVTLTLTKGRGDGLFLVYGPSHLFDAKYGSERHTVLGMCDGIRSDQVEITDKRVINCTFAASLVKGLKYTYELYILYDGKVYRLSRGVVVPK